MTGGVPAFVEQLRGHGDRLAVLTADERLTYAQLAERVEQVATAIGSERRLVLVEAANDLPALLGYLGALYGGHVALLAPRSDGDQVAGLVERFDPDVVIGADCVVRACRPGGRHRLHPELALLLATSGSTGAPRLVRLSAAALDANAAAIGTYLGITADDRAALTLPLYYCYGLSVINSNLLAGAGVLLTEQSVTEPAFWAAVRSHGITGLHGVPYTFELLDRIGFAQLRLPVLRYVTQAGGRLPPEQVRRWARIGRRSGWQLFVMYGQTEATARMAYLPPDLAETHPGAVGVAIPGGTITIEPLDPADPPSLGAVGELVYRGPNVMLGYADHPDDLALGRTVHALRTGDLGRFGPGGLLEITGRRSRFVKPFGIRTDLDGVEKMLSDRGIEAACTGTDTALVIAARTGTSVPDGALRDRVRSIVTDRLGLPVGMVTVLVVDELPRRPNGKLDHPAVARFAERQAAATVRLADVRFVRRRPATVREIFTDTFAGKDLSDDASFVDLGGDSLTYVQVSADLERVLGRLPAGWDRTPLGVLESMTPSTGDRPTWRATIETATLVRALAIVMVVGEHAHLWAIVGGAHLLLALSGWTFARFVLARDHLPVATSHVTPHRTTPRRILGSAARIAVPTAAWIAFRALLGNVRFLDILLLGSLAPPLVAGYWFTDDLVQILLVLALVFALPALRHLERRHPFGFAATLLLLALLGWHYPTAYGYWFTTDIYSTQIVAWLFVLGWMAHRASTTAQRTATVAAVLVLVPTFFGADALRTIIVVAGLLLVQFLPTLTVSRAVAGPATAIASASLAIYLTHFGILPLAALGVPPVGVLAVSVVVGITTSSRITAALRYRRGSVPARDARSGGRNAHARTPEALISAPAQGVR